MDSTLDPERSIGNWDTVFPIISEEDIRNFATLIKDTNPVHHDTAAAQKAGHHGIIAPGVMMIGFVSSAIATKIPGVQVRRLEMKFVAPLYAGSTPCVQCAISGQSGQLAKVAVAVKNGFEEVASGSCMLLLPQ